MRGDSAVALLARRRPAAIVGACSSGRRRRSRSTRRPTELGDDAPTTRRRTPSATAGRRRRGRCRRRPCRIDVTAPGAPISPLILGISSSLDRRRDATTPGSRSTAGAATRRPGTTTRSVTPGTTAPTTSSATPTTAATGDAARRLPRRRAPRPASQSRVAVPTLGWVARDDLDDDVLVPRRRRRLPAGERGRQLRATSPVADPDTGQRREHAGGRRRLGRRARRRRLRHRYHRHGQRAGAVGVHPLRRPPECPTYEEILDKYLTYADGRPRGRARTPSSPAR